MLLAHSGPRMDREFQSSISGQDYTYFSGLSQEAQHMELVELTFHTHQISIFVAFKVTSQR